ncbi:MAG: hypothetical protein P3T54_01970 [Dehalogenimonas sp.]|uniref:Uncharacterized protein n=1 Tax=Candidatus Dehalogenimonas loeffleri TaxID=3127115 RepID=A0ABZ2J904_9CHLR|nr:hypothetical protein [Dehalogenimonas sp.]
MLNPGFWPRAGILFVGMILTATGMITGSVFASVMGAVFFLVGVVGVVAHFMKTDG